MVAVVAVPGFVEGMNGDVEQLMRKFGNCRRRAYAMKGNTETLREREDVFLLLVSVVADMD